MEMKLTLPDEVVRKLGDDPEREVLEGVLLLLVGDGKMSLERAGEILGLDDAGLWFEQHSRSVSGGSRQSEREDPILSLGEDPVDDEVTDASVNHDRYLYGV
jgi:hypothetical protein